MKRAPRRIRGGHVRAGFVNRPQVWVWRLLHDDRGWYWHAYAIAIAS